MNRMTVNEMKADLKAKIASIKQTRQEIKTLRNDIKRERDIQKTRRTLGIIKKQFVKIPHAVKHQRVWKI